MQAGSLRRLVLLVVLALGLSACPADEGRGDPDDMAIATGTGVTEAPCPEAANPDNGCISLGIISDLTSGPFASFAAPATEAQQAFWQRVNEDGGIGGFDVDATTHVRDNGYDPQRHVEAFEGLREDVLALAQSFGSVHTAAILDDLRDDDIVAVPGSWTSAWAFEDVVLASGASYCVEAMNAVDHAFAAFEELDTVMAIHFTGDYGADAAAGVARAVEQHEGVFTALETDPGADNQAVAIAAVLAEEPDLVFIATGPLEMATILGQAAARGYQGRFIGSGPTWTPALLESPAADVIADRYWQAAPWGPFSAATSGHEALREALGDVAPSDGHVAGWISQYPIKAAIEAAVDRGDLTRAGLRAALDDLTQVDYEGMLPSGAGNFAADDPDERAFRESVVTEVDPDAPTGLRVREDFFAGPTARAFELSDPCFRL